MADKDPFAEPGDTERTVVRPNPGARRPQQDPYAQPPQQPDPYAQPQPQTPVSNDGLATPAQAPADPGLAGIPDAAGQAARPKPGTAPEASVSLAMTGMNRLNASAATLFALISRIRNRAQHMDPDALRKSVVGEIRAFENRALQAGIDAQQVKIARYAICATLDDVVLNTPWGGESVWATQSMVGTFHRETVGGDRFFDLLARLEKDPGNNIDLLEFLYMCLSLGFEGRLRVEHGGTDRHLQIREGLARVIRGQRGEVEADLSPQWEGVEKPHKTVNLWKPLWISLGAVALILGVTFGTFSFLLSNKTENLIGQLTTLELDDSAIPQLLRRAPPPPPPPPLPVRINQVEQVSGFLTSEQAAGTVKLKQTVNTITIQVAGAGMFASGSDQLQDAFQPVLSRIAEALDSQSGPIIIAGYTDNIPVRGGRFGSNQNLSRARAETVRAFVASRIADPTRLRAEGRGEKDPIADNSTREGRAANRRIEIIIVKAN